MNSVYIVVKHMIKSTILFLISVVIITFWVPQEKIYAKEPVIIVIDPGHGGENLGAEYEEYTEKNMTMTVAQAMKEELEKYDDVIVYLTHESPEDDMTLEERVLFAVEKNADFLFCLHFNMSVNHNLFGAEVWVPAFDRYYAKGYAFAEIQMELLSELGLYSRGIKTKLNDKGEDYYGILRHSTQEGLPAVLIEHCHLDQENDKPFYTQGEEQLKELGRIDAEAAAKYFGLTSQGLGVDYSEYKVSEIAIPNTPVKSDKTEPDICELELVEINQDTREITLTLYASDFDSYILYYDYSIDGGNTYSQLRKWDKTEESMTFSVVIPPDTDVELRATAYNGFDVWIESNIIQVEGIPESIVIEQELIEELVLADSEEDMILEGDIVENNIIEGNIVEDDIVEDGIIASNEQIGKIESNYLLWIGILIGLVILCLLILVSRLFLFYKIKGTSRRSSNVED